MAVNEKWIARWQNSVMPTYRTPKLVFSKGEGTRVWDVDGNVYTDMFSGLAVNVLGHAHPNIVEAVSAQVARLGQISNYFASEPQIELAERLLELFGEQGATGKVFFCNSGAEAAEAAFKITRRTGRTEIIASESGFHGRTMGALAMTGQPPKRQPFEPLPGDVTHVPFGDIDALVNAVSNNTAAVILEPILGEAGVIPLPPGYLAKARAITKEVGALLIVDEVQTGFGRTGSWFGFQWEHIEPDIVLLAKQLGGGLPIGACIAFGEAAELLQPGQHGTTFGGNPIACAAALAVLNTIHESGLIAHSSAVGRQLMIGIDGLGHPLIKGVRGRGLMIGIGLNAPVAENVVAIASRHGYLVNATSEDVVRIAPPLIFSAEEADVFIGAFRAVLDEAQ